MSETCGKNCACAAAAAASTETKTGGSETKTAGSTKAEAPKGGAFRNGKGSAPRNISTKFRSNFDQIKWS